VCVCVGGGGGGHDAVCASESCCAAHCFRCSGLWHQGADYCFPRAAALFAQQGLTFCDKIDEVAEHNAAVGSKLAHVHGIQSRGAASDDHFAIEMGRRVAERDAAGRAVRVAIGHAITAVLRIVSQAVGVEASTTPEDGDAVSGARQDIVGASETTTGALSRARAAAALGPSERDSAAAAAAVIDATRCAANAARVIAIAADAADAADGADGADAVAGRLEDAALQFGRAWARVVDYPAQVDFERALHEHVAASASTMEQLAREVVDAHAAMIAAGAGDASARLRWIRAISALSKHTDAYAASVAAGWEACTKHVDGMSEHALVQCWQSYRAALEMQHATEDTLIQGYVRCALPLLPMA
jgi:hypothetical protein